MGAKWKGRDFHGEERKLKFFRCCRNTWFVEGGFLNLSHNSPVLCAEFATVRHLFCYSRWLLWIKNDSL